MSNAVDLLVNKIGWQLALHASTTQAMNLTRQPSPMNNKLIELLDHHFQPEITLMKKEMDDGWKPTVFTMTLKNMEKVYWEAYQKLHDGMVTATGIWDELETEQSIRYKSDVLKVIGNGGILIYEPLEKA